MSPTPDSLGKRSREEANESNEAKKQRVEVVELPGLHDAQEVWKKLEAQEKCKLKGPASSESFAELEEQHNIVLPAEFKALYSLYDGEEETKSHESDHDYIGLFGDQRVFLPIDGILFATEYHEEDVDCADNAEIEDDWEYKSSIIFGYDYEEGSSSYYLLKMFEKDGEYAYDVVLKGCDDEDTYGMPFGCGKDAKGPYTIQPRKNQFALWFQAYSKHLCGLEDLSKLSYDTTAILNMKPEETFDFWHFHVAHIQPTQNKSARK